MKNIKNAFTLSEVLIALTIVGVIAAITIPQLVNNIQKAKTGPMLGKIVNQIELGCKNMLKEDFDSTVDDGGQPAEVLSAISKDEYKFTEQNLAKYVGATKSGEYYIFDKYQAGYKVTIKSSNNSIAEITIDTNATKKPDELGKDQFSFYLRDEGRLIPKDDVTRKIVANGFRIKD